MQKKGAWVAGHTVHCVFHAEIVATGYAARMPRFGIDGRALHRRARRARVWSANDKRQRGGLLWLALVTEASAKGRGREEEHVVRTSAMRDTSEYVEFMLS